MNMVQVNEPFITRKLRASNGFWFTLYAAITAFCLYTCVYAFRKTFTAATFDELYYWGISYKVWLITFQVVGYGMAKFAGIKVISELRAKDRASGILLMVTIAAVSWFFFAIVPAPYNLIFLFANGFPLGMVWGMVFGYMEGRRMTEVLGSALAVSFIFSAGLCRTVGGILMRDWGISEFWMPFAASCIFAIPLLIFLYLVDKIPPPSRLDEELRTKRQPMDSFDRKKFLHTFLPGIVLFVLVYMLLTAFRDFRENFSSDVWKTLGYGDSPGIFTKTETPVSLAVLIIMGTIMLIRNNKRALMVNHLIIMAGMVLIGISTLLFENKTIDAPLWMILIGTGLYMGYIPFNSIFFDRLIAAFRYVGTVGFIMYVADAFGYVGSVGVLFFKEFTAPEMSYIDLFISGGYMISVAGSLLILASMWYFHKKHQGWVKQPVILASSERVTSADIPNESQARHN
ncbi:MAG TPA: DUF5690 family protein [Chryseosolibacter sp.]